MKGGTMKSKIVFAVLGIAAIVCFAGGAYFVGAWNALNEYAMSNLSNADAAIAANGMGKYGLAAVLCFALAACDAGLACYALNAFE